MAKRLKIWHKDFTSFPATNSTLIDIQNYNWNFEVSRDLFGYESRARFDLFGTCLKGTISDRRPEIIIEVADSHCLSKELFKYLIQRSEQIPCVVLFYFVSQEALLNKCGYQDLSVTAYIKNGQFYYGGIPIKELKPEIQEGIQNPFLYFNQSDQNIVKKIKKGSKVDIGNLKKSNR